MKDSFQKKVLSVKNWLLKHKWNFKETISNIDEVTISFNQPVESMFLKEYNVLILCRDDEIRLTVCFPFKVKEKDYSAIIGYFAVVNHRIRAAKWILDFNSSKVKWNAVRYTSGDDCDIESVMNELFGLATKSCDCFLDGIFGIALGCNAAKTIFEKGVKIFESDTDFDDNICYVEDVADDSNWTALDGEARHCSSNRGECESQNDDEVQNFDVPDRKGTELPSCYSLQGLNIESSIPLEQIIEAAKAFRMRKCEEVDAPRLNILLSGVPGSGKTAFVKYLATEIGMSLRTVKAGEVLRPYIGETEAEILRIFTEAKKNDEILFLDEIDSLLLNRVYADKSWMLSQTNALLQEMESFSGILLGATNLVDRLDPAVMRRFTFKLKLSYLTNDGKETFFSRYFGSTLTETEKTRLFKIERLTPGDFRTVKESLFYLPGKQTNDARLKSLEEESESKGGGVKKIGF